jgi:hypothetical protein
MATSSPVEPRNNGRVGNALRECGPGKKQHRKECDNSRLHVVFLWAVAWIELVTTPACAVRDCDHGVAATAGAGSDRKCGSVRNDNLRARGDR